MTAPIDVLIVGGGPAGLATAIRLKQQLAAAAREASVVVIEKAPRPGYHNLSGASFEPACLDELVPGWRDDRRFMEHVSPVERDDMYFLLGQRAIRIPDLVVPKGMHHHGDVTISLSRLTAFLAAKAEAAGVELYHGYSARTLLVEGDRVVGVEPRRGRAQRPRRRASRTTGRPRRSGPGSRSWPTARAASSRSSCASASVRGRNPQVYSLGIKAVVAFPGDNPFGPNRVMHTLGYPNPASVFGGGFLYSMGEKLVAVGLILGLDWKYGDLNPQREFERYRAHPFIAGLLKGSVTIATGARTIPEGGFHALGKLAVPGALVVGDGAGFVNMEKIKGIHYGILSGMAAAETVVEGLAADGDAVRAVRLRKRLEERGVLPAMRHARNYRPSFRWGTYAGAPLSMVSSHIPRRLGMEPDFKGTKQGARLDRRGPGRHGRGDVRQPHRLPPPRGRAGAHDDPGPGGVRALRGRLRELLHHFCPGQVYRWDGSKIVLSASNCLHCMTCAVKCPLENIRWLPPEGGEGPRFKQM